MMKYTAIEVEPFELRMKGVFPNNLIYFYLLKVCAMVKI